MTILTVMIVAAMLAAVASLGFGVAAMVSDGQVNHQGSVQWMVWRVSFQALAFVLILMALVG
ncbi:MAG: hypothetical protein AABZ67_07320 [Pseudomonadota bacterium]